MSEAADYVVRLVGDKGSGKTHVALAMRDYFALSADVSDGFSGGKQNKELEEASLALRNRTWAEMTRPDGAEILEFKMTLRGAWRSVSVQSLSGEHVSRENDSAEVVRLLTEHVSFWVANPFRYDKRLAWYGVTGLISLLQASDDYAELVRRPGAPNLLHVVSDAIFGARHEIGQGPFAAAAEAVGRRAEKIAAMFDFGSILAQEGRLAAINTGGRPIHLDREWDEIFNVLTPKNEDHAAHQDAESVKRYLKAFSGWFVDNADDTAGWRKPALQQAPQTMLLYTYLDIFDQINLQNFNGALDRVAERLVGHGWKNNGYFGETFYQTGPSFKDVSKRFTEPLGIDHSNVKHFLELIRKKLEAQPRVRNWRMWPIGGAREGKLSNAQVAVFDARRPEVPFTLTRSIAGRRSSRPLVWFGGSVVIATVIALALMLVVRWPSVTHNTESAVTGGSGSNK
jgi:hypothetical protein